MRRQRKKSRDCDRQNGEARDIFLSQVVQSLAVHKIESVVESGITVETLCAPLKLEQRYGTLVTIMSSLEAQPSVKLGFCNGELRPHFEVRLQHETQACEVYAEETVDAKRLVHIAGTYNGDVLKLFVNCRLVAEQKRKGVLERLPTPFFLSGKGLLVSTTFMRIWSRAKTLEELRQMAKLAYPANRYSTRLERTGDSFNNAFLSFDEIPECLAWYAAPPLQPSERKIDLSTRILAAAGIPESEQGTSMDRCAQAGKTLLACCDELESLIDDFETREPKLLAYFRENPAATFLLEPDQEEAWREQQIQGYGQIDFVFRKTNHRYVVVEIEGSEQRVFNQNDDFSQIFNHATQQVVDWQRGVSKQPHIPQSVLGMAGIDSPDGMVVIGRAREIEQGRRMEKWNAMCGQSNLTFLTWDDVVRRGRSLGHRLGNPNLPELEWS